MKTIPLIILYDEQSNTSRAYLEYLHRNNLAPQEVLLLRFITAKTKRIARYVGNKIAYKIFTLYKLLNDIKNGFIVSKENAHDFQTGFEAIDFAKKINLKHYTANVKELYLESFADDSLASYATKNSNNYFLYTAGGIVPSKFLSLPNVKLLHIHPGVVPFVKGSDGFFWSVLTRNKPGASCFFMDETIDTGAIIHTQEFAKPAFDRKLLDAVGYHGVYNGILNYYDPHLRGSVLIETLKKTNLLTSIDGKKQDPNDGCTYFTMHSKLIEKTIDKLIK